LTQATARRWAQGPGLVLLCGRYEGFDARIETHVDEVVSLGDFVLNGGEVAAMAIVEAVARLLPGVIGNAASLEQESHGHGLLEYPQYTRPRDFEGQIVPDALLSGDHAKIAQWRRQQSLERTRDRRPDLLATAALSAQDRAWLQDGGQTDASAKSRRSKPRPD
jgi:tRNA (guanine37-N1)-methyltransferase